MLSCFSSLRFLLPVMAVMAAVPALSQAETATPPAAAPTKIATPQKKSAAPKKSSKALAADDTLTVKDTDETYTLPEYPIGARIAIGEMKKYVTQEEDTFLDIARHFGLGYVELRAANMGVDPWSPPPGTALVIPQFNLLPRARQEGIVVNLSKMRLYYFRDPGKPPLTYAIGIGRDGLSTPLGHTTIVRRAERPSWFPTERMRREKPELPRAVAPGASNPLGAHALYLGWPTFLIHGSNKPWGIGRRVSSGCLRMYPEDIEKLFGIAPVGTKVTVVDQPILVGWLDDGLYLEANPSQTQSSEIEFDQQMTEKPLSDAVRDVIRQAAGVAASRIDWQAVEQAMLERKGYPVKIATPSPARKTTTRAQQKYDWNR